MAWRYCDHCKAGLDQPTDREALTDDYNCPQCGSTVEVNYDEKETAYGNLIDRIEKLEKLTHTHFGMAKNV